MDSLNIGITNIKDMEKAKETFDFIMGKSVFYGYSAIEKLVNDIVNQKDKDIAMEFTKRICELLKSNGIFVICDKSEIEREDINNGTISYIDKYSFNRLDTSKHDKEFLDRIEKLEKQLEENKRKLKDKEMEISDLVKEAKSNIDANQHNISYFEKQISFFNEEIEKRKNEAIKYKNESEIKNDEIQKLKSTISNLEESNGRLKSNVDTYVNYILPRATKEAKEFLDKNCYENIRIVAIGEKNESKEINQNETIEVFLPDKPIELAEMLINAKMTRCGYNFFDISELKQIAEHLLVYCNNAVDRKGM